MIKWPKRDLKSFPCQNKGAPETGKIFYLKTETFSPNIWATLPRHPPPDLWHGENPTGKKKLSSWGPLHLLPDSVPFRDWGTLPQTPDLCWITFIAL
ncbi:hypothetical protein JTE90_029715 [Oedothorax gibbosus]|uniref:Uncharacterized protein n=1 Tax=Oedothorax gibbosus TaxID=931172 RepID=A0AAV6TJY2_9ARAC|nr:hypothetical protein JTE90_029715 [Oedothorax gibbosus]